MIAAPRLWLRTGIRISDSSKIYNKNVARARIIADIPKMPSALLADRGNVAYALLWGNHSGWTKRRGRKEVKSGKGKSLQQLVLLQAGLKFCRVI